MNNKKFIIGLVVAVVLAGVALAIHYNVVQPDGPLLPDVSQGDEEIPWDFESIDSSYCIDCHTSEAVIAASTYNEDNPPAEDTGG
jgi:hypothetical protein